MKNQKVFLHNLSIEYAHASDELFDFDQNALFFAEPGDIVVTRKKISEEYLLFLTQCGMNFDGVKFVSSESNASSGMKDIFSDESIISQLQSMIDRKRNPVLDCFILTEHEVKWAKKLGLIYEGQPEHEAFGGKSAFRSLAKKNGFSVARGFENQNNVLDGALKSAWLLSTGFSEVIVKYDEGVAALGSQRFTREDILTRFRTFENFLFNKYTHGVLPKYSKNFVIEGWYDDALYSPSIQLFITPSGNVEFLSTHIQLFYENKMRYRGCLSSNFIEEDVQKDLVTNGISLATVFARKGYRGHLAFNTIFLPSRKLLWEELNPRRVMSSYPFQICKRMFNDEGKNMYYASKNIQNFDWEGKTINDIINFLKYKFVSDQNGDGIIPFNYGLLSTEGLLSFIVFADNKKRVMELLKYVETF